MEILFVQVNIVIKDFRWKQLKDFRWKQLNFANLHHTNSAIKPKP